jgi:hypothetical protein
MTPERTDHYVLVNRTAVPCPDLKVWAWFMGAAALSRRVAVTEGDANPDAEGADGWIWEDDDGGNHYATRAKVSTVFLGLDHAFGEGPPILFESMVFPVDDNGRVVYAEVACNRYSTWDEAVIGHANLVDEYLLDPLKAP